MDRSFGGLPHGGGGFSTNTAELSPEDHDTLLAHFHLPFPAVSLDGPDGNTIVIDEREDVVGLYGHRRRYAITNPMTGGDGKNAGKAASFVWGWFRVTGPAGANFLFAVEMEGAGWMGEGGEVVGFMPKSQVPHDMSRGVTDSLAVAVEQLRAINLPSKVVFEINPPVPKKAGPKFPRSHERPIYTLLSPDEVTKRYPQLGASSGERKGPRPHARRLRDARTRAAIQAARADPRAALSSLAAAGAPPDLTGPVAQWSN